MSEPLGSLHVLACDSRMRILRLLQDRGEPVPVDEVAREVGLHVNTTREHLDRLVDGGFVSRQAERRTTRGRPRVMYWSVDNSAVATVTARAREHLVDLLARGYGRALRSPRASAERAGRAWAGRLGCPGGPSSANVDRDAQQQLGALERHFAELGFQPQADPEQLVVRLHNCPFADAAHERAEVVCGAHLGLAEGVLARHEGPLQVAGLDPFVDADHCVLRLRR